MENIKFFEKKYGGTFENTLKFKQNKSQIEETDANEWAYHLRRLNK